MVIMIAPIKYMMIVVIVVMNRNTCTAYFILGEREYLSRSLPNETVGFSFGFSGFGFSFVNKFSKRKITGMFDNGCTIFTLVNM